MTEFDNCVLISKNVQLTFKLTALGIYISNEGEVIIVASQIGPDAPCPHLTVEYLESLCRDFYYGGKPHAHAIADVLLLNRLLSKNVYGDFYDCLYYNLGHQNITLICSELFQ